MPFKKHIFLFMVFFVSFSVRISDQMGQDASEPEFVQLETNPGQLSMTTTDPVSDTAIK